MNINFLESERWYPAVSTYGSFAPLKSDTSCTLSFRNNSTMNQMTSLLVSNFGRYIYCESGFDAIFNRGLISIINYTGDIDFYEGGNSLKDAVRAFLQKHDKGDNKALKIAREFTDTPIYNTWIELTYNQNQRDVLSYARNLLENGFTAGTIIIDDGWSDYYGKWEFNKERFPDPEKMIKDLKNMGFNIMLWIVPYISADTKIFRELWEKGCLLEEDNKAYILRWWNGASACIDMRKANAVKWLNEQLSRLMKIGIDGFKFDGGDSLYYLPEHEPDVQCHLWAKFASQYEFNEIRADFNTQGLSIMERLSDKKHEWGIGGIASLIPDALALGLGGHPILSPDMIGGGEYKCFINLDDKDFDRELLLKNTAIAAFMPVIQFSVNPARIWKEGLPKIHDILNTRKKIEKYYSQLVKESLCTKEPIIRYLEYVFPHQELSDITDQYMLGDKYMLAPIYTKNDKTRKIILPKGKWRDEYGNILGDENKNITIDSNSLIGLFEHIE